MSGITDDDIKRIVRAVASAPCPKYAVVDERLKQAGRERDDAKEDRQNLYVLQEQISVDVAALVGECRDRKTENVAHKKAHGLWLTIGLKLPGVLLALAAVVAGALKVLGAI